MIMRSYEEVLEAIESSRRFGKAPGVEVTKAVLEKLGHPDMGLSYIHVAGTNGKGSVCAFLESLAIAGGYKVGKFTSPHLIRFTERITVNRKEISTEDVTRLGNELLDIEFPLELTMFDYCLAMAVLYFKEQRCDFVILETGLGGRLDSTSALYEAPMACVITRIGFDHMAILGDTIEEIAGEKAGIIRPGCPVIVAPQEKKASTVIKKQYEKVNGVTKLYGRSKVPDILKEKQSFDFMEKPVDYASMFLKENYHIEKKEPEKTENTLTLVSRADMNRIKSLPLRMVGAYQLENAATALVTAEKTFLKSELLGPLLGKREIENSLCTAYWPGRMEILSRDPFLMVDGAHNANGVEALAKSLKKLYPGEDFHFVMGVMADKDYLQMIETLLPIANDFVTVTPENARALQGEELAKLIEERDVPARFEKDWKHVLDVYLNNAEAFEGEKLICFGSLYFIGDVKSYLECYR